MDSVPSSDSRIKSPWNVSSPQHKYIFIINTNTLSEETKNTQPVNLMSADRGGGGGKGRGKGGGRLTHWKESTKWTVTIKYTLCLVVKWELF